LGPRVDDAARGAVRARAESTPLNQAGSVAPAMQ
jgi:hypothetical protein